MPAPQVRPATPADREVLLDTLTLSFAADPCARFLWPSPQVFMANWRRFALAMGGPGLDHDAAWVADGGAAAALWLPPGVESDSDAVDLLIGETDENNPFVPEEQMMPFLPFVRVPDVDTAIALAKKHEHGFRHTAIIHSRNVETITRMGVEMDVTLFVQNGPSMASLGLGGEGYLSFSIATPTGEGVTTPLTFTRQRRSAIRRSSTRICSGATRTTTSSSSAKRCPCPGSSRSTRSSPR